jgi:hypothetical protein
MNLPPQQGAPTGQSRPEEWHISKDGQRFNLYADRWKLSAHATLNVAALRYVAWLPVIAEGAVRTLAEYAVKAASATVISIEHAMRKFLQFVPPHARADEISHSLVLSYRDFCHRRDGHDFKMSSWIRPFLRAWHVLGHPGVSKELVETMYGWSLRNPEQGVAVNRLDANAGPLMPDEHVSLAVHWLTAFEQGTMPVVDYVMARLCSVTGRRAGQIMQLKLKDMDDTRFEDPEPGRPPCRIMLLHIPRNKRRGVAWRTRFRAVPLSIDLWNLLMMQRNAVHEQLDALLEGCGLSLQPSDLAAIRSDMPLIPASQVIKDTAARLRATAQRGHGEAIKELFALASSDAWHALNTRLSHALEMETVGVVNRDGGPIHVFPKRMRYTREFDLERAGYAPAVIAWNMDHSDTKSLAAYSKNGPERARKIGDAMALKLAPFVRIFQGRVVADEAEAEGGDDPKASRILFQNLTPGATCAAKRGCGMSAIPRPCYDGCPHFRPWVNGPHEEYLESLLEERERALGLLRPVEDRAVIEAADSLIISVVQVIRLCDERRAELAVRSNAAGTRGARRGAAK